MPLKIAFFGTPDRAVIALDTLKSLGIVPELIVTQPDKPQGRKFVITPPEAKIWAQKEGVPVLQPEKLNDVDFQNTLKSGNFHVFVVVAYGKIMPESVLGIPKFGCINIHGSLLPELRGASPIETAILLDKKDTGVTIMVMDKEVDHGSIIAQKKAEIKDWPIRTDELAKIIVTDGAKLLASVLPDFVAGKIKAVEQDHSNATFTKKISKGDAVIDFSGDPYQNLLKIKAYSSWPRAYFFESSGTRVSVSDASIIGNKLVPTRVTPEGKKEMSWDEYSRGRKM